MVRVFAVIDGERYVISSQSIREFRAGITPGGITFETWPGSPPQISAEAHELLAGAMARGESVAVAIVYGFTPREIELIGSIVELTERRLRLKLSAVNVNGSNTA